MNIINESIESIFSKSKINEDLIIYNGRFCIYTDRQLKCNGTIYYKITEPASINFNAKIHKYSELKEENFEYNHEIFDNITLDIPGYKPMEGYILNIKAGEVRGYIDDLVIKSKDNEVDYVQFDIINMDKIPGKLVKHKNLLYAARLEFDINNYKVIIDKSFDYNKEFHSELVSKTGCRITHTGRIYKKDYKPFKTKKVYDMIRRISTALSFCCGRYINIPNIFGFKGEKEVYRSWNKMYSTDYKFVFKWTTTISNYHNFEKYLSLMCKKLEDNYYNETIINVLDWYIESLNGINLGNNIISIQTALEMLSYVVLVETDKILSCNEFDGKPANQNIRKLLQKCEIDYKIPDNMFFSDKLISQYRDGVDLITYYRNRVVHPSKSTNGIYLSFEEMWDIILLGVNYIELVILYLLKYKGEYTNRFIDYSFGDVEIVPWAQKK